MKSLYFLMLIIIGQLACGASLDHADVSRLVLNKTLHPFVTEKSEQKTKSTSYCPDNICLSFEAPSKVAWDRVYDFSILFLLYKSGFPEFVEDGYKMPSGLNAKEEFASIESSIIIRYPVCTKEQGQSEKVECVLKRIQKQYGVSAFFMREDEGVVIKSEQDIM